jgi:hypothetical protein
MNISMTKATVISLLILLMFPACSDTLRVLPVTKISDTQDALIYNLPKTALIIEAEVEKTVTFKGPFSEYTDLYFQSNRSVKRNETYYRLKNIQVSSIARPDSAHYYGILSPPEFLAGSFLSLDKNLAPTGINTDIEFEEETGGKKIQLSNTQEYGPDYADLSIKSVRETVYDTIYTDVFRDSVFVKVPKVYARKQFKSPEKQAKEMAEQIFRLRDDRLALLKGVTDANNFPDGEAVKLMIAELDKYEKQYMNMFTGQKVKSSKKHKFIIVPEADIEEETFVLFRFSERFGILPAHVEQGESLNLKIKKSKELHTVAAYENYKDNQLKQKKQETAGFVYRIPNYAEIIVSYKDEVLFNDRMHIAQLGVLSKIPVELIGKPNVQILFYPQLGALKKISEKNALLNIQNE